MNLSRLKGNRTYLTVVAAIVYLLGGKYGLWPLDKEVIGIIAFLAVGFLRAATGVASNAAKGRQAASLGAEPSLSAEHDTLAGPRGTLP